VVRFREGGMSRDLCIGNRTSYVEHGALGVAALLMDCSETNAPHYRFPGGSTPCSAT